ncbi:MAG: sulfotransferase family 2 domain-containing protein [Pseudomonadota bacterium]
MTLAPMYVFLHIRKTGGTSLRWILESKFPTREILRCYPVHGCERSEIPSFLEKFPNQFRLLVTMEGYGVSDVLPNNVAFLKMLRDPSRRCLSNYFHWYVANPLRQKDNGVHSMEDYFERLVDLRLDNVQVRNVSGALTVPDLSEHHLELAKRSLESFAFVGLAERFEESLTLLAATMGWSHIPYKVSGPSRL